MRALALLLLWAGPALGAGQARFAVVIGANRGEADEVVLRFAEQDAVRFADVLTRYAGVPEEHLTLLKGRDAGRTVAAFAPLAGRIAAAQAEGRETVLFVYYSGHADGQALHLAGTRLPLAQLKGLLADSGAQVAVLVVDACRSGALTRVKGAAPAEPFAIHAEDHLASEGTAIIASSAAGEDAQESDQLAGGVFSHHLISGLLGAADATGDREVTLSEAYRYAYRETLRTTSAARFVQHPTYDFRLRGRDDLRVTRLSDEAGRGRVRLAGAGAWLLLPQGRGEVVELSAEAGAEVLVVPGTYVARFRGDGRLLEATASVGAGVVTALSPEAMTAVPYGLAVRKGLSQERRAALGPLVAVEVAGPLRDGQSVTARGAVGLRVDLAPLSLEVRAVYGYAQAENAVVDLAQHSLGLDVAALRLFDFGPVAAGLGVRLGVDGVQQSFETLGEAPDRQGLVGRAGPTVRLEVAAAAGLSFAAFGGLDGLLLRRGDGRVGLEAVPSGGLGVTLYVP
ncbi:MAG: caspase family protein [Myxococcales bacterium]|nr:caspase family protein [Myxococcales bacterium]